jgi:transcriptional regulator with XRE-family HTH domain
MCRGEPFERERRKKVKESFKITLKAARYNVGLSRKNAAVLFGIHPETLGNYEQNSERVPRSFFSKVEDVYGIPVGNIYFGKEEDFIKEKRKALSIV